MRSNFAGIFDTLNRNGMRAKFAAVHISREWASIFRHSPISNAICKSENTLTKSREIPRTVSSFHPLDFFPQVVHAGLIKRDTNSSRITMKFVLPSWVGLSVIAAVIQLCPATKAGELTRLVAWGDISYDLTNDVTQGGTPVAGIAAGDFHSLALQRNGSIVAWGDDRFGQSELPSLLTQKPAVKIAAGNVHNVALLGNGTVIAWGGTSDMYGTYGQDAVPAGLNKVKAIAAGAVHSLALKRDGTVAAWGYDGYGQCDVPSGLNNVTAIAGGMFHSLALKKDGTVVAWGCNDHGESSVPAGLNHVVAIAAGGYHSLALKSDGTVVAWGTYGLVQCTVPEGLSNVVAIATGDYHSVVLKRDGSVAAWGLNSLGQCNVPTDLKNVKAISARGNHTMALMKAGKQ